MKLPEMIKVTRLKRRIKLRQLLHKQGCKVVTEILTPGAIVKASKASLDKYKVYRKGRLVGFMKDGSPVIEFESGALGIFDNVEPYNEKEENIKKVKDLMADLGVMKEDL